MFRPISSPVLVKSAVLCLFLICSCPRAHAQDHPETKHAAVVFFTPGGHWRGTVSQLKTTLFGKGDIASMGSVFDGKVRLASLTHTRYVALRTTPGSHTFSANLTGNHPKPSETVTVDLKDGSVTYIAVTTTIVNYGLGVYEKLTSHIETASCREFTAEKTDQHLEPIDPKHVAEPFRVHLASLDTLPPCGE